MFSAVRELFSELKSLRLTWKTSLPYLFSNKERSKEVTEQYPDPISSRSPEDLPPRSRGLLYNDIQKCTGCGDCVKVCPVACIAMQAEPGPDASKLWVSNFDIDFSSCTFCGLCADACLPASLKHTHEYERASRRILNLTGSFGAGQITNELREKWASIRQSREENEFS